MAFTDAQIKNLKPKKKRSIVWEDGATCLGLRITPSGKKSFIYMYRYDSRSRMMTLGQYPVLTLADARVDLAKAKGDPMQERLLSLHAPRSLKKMGHGLNRNPL